MEVSLNSLFSNWFHVYMFSFFTRLRFFLKVASEIKLGPSVSPAVISSVSFPPAGIQRKRERERESEGERGETVWLLEGMWEACNVLCAGPIDLCQRSGL